MNPQYKLTRHSIGSLKEIWTISWPLMLGLLSGSLMMFADRFLLARYSTQALNAAITAGMANYIVLIIPLIIAGISEVFVGRYHGAGEASKVGKPVWQMIWLSVFATPIFWLCTEFLPPLFFHDGSQALLETAYFQWMIYFAPSFCSTVALMGFFIGIGKVRIVTICALAGNMINIVLDLAFIFGIGPIPEMGIKGAALATGLSQLCQTLFLLALFLNPSYKVKYGTSYWQFDWKDFKEGIRIGAPAGLGRFLEVIAHFIFFQIVALSGSETLTIIGIVQSFYILISFVIEGLSKGVSSIVANLLGGQQDQLISKVLKTAMKLQALLACLFGFILLGFSKPLISLFLNEQDSLLIAQPETFSSIYTALFWMALFFLFDGFSWIYAGLLTASGDTKFLLYAGIGLNWFGYVLPTYLLFAWTPWGNASNGWLLIAFYALLTFAVYLIRYRSGKWKHAFAVETTATPLEENLAASP